MNKKIVIKNLDKRLVIAICNKSAAIRSANNVSINLSTIMNIVQTS